MTKTQLEIILGTYEEYLLGYKILPRKSEVTQTFATHSHTSSVRCVTTCGNLLASGGADDRIFVYNLKERREYCILDHHSSTVNCLAFSPDGSHILSGSADGVFAITRVGNWQVEKVFTKAHKGAALLDIAVHPTGKMALTLGADASLRTWNLIKGRQAYITNLKSKCKDYATISGVRWLPCGTRFTLYGGKHVTIWSTETGGIVHTYEFAHKTTCCTFLDADRLITGHENGDVTILNVTQPDDDGRETIHAHASRVKALCTCANSRYLITACSNGDFKVFNSKRQYKEMAHGRSGCRITCLSLNPMADALVDVKKDESAAEVDVEEGDEVQSSKLKRRVVVEMEDEEAVATVRKRKAKKRKPLVKE